MSSPAPTAPEDDPRKPGTAAVGVRCSAGLGGNHSFTEHFEVVFINGKFCGRNPVTGEIQEMLARNEPLQVIDETGKLRTATDADRALITRRLEEALSAGEIPILETEA